MDLDSPWYQSILLPLPKKHFKSCTHVVRHAKHARYRIIRLSQRKLVADTKCSIEMQELSPQSKSMPISPIRSVAWFSNITCTTFIANRTHQMKNNGGGSNFSIFTPIMPLKCLPARQKIRNIDFDSSQCQNHISRLPKKPFINWAHMTRQTTCIQTICLHDNKVLAKKIYIGGAIMFNRNVGVVRSEEQHV